VTERGHCDRAEAVFHARCVIETVEEAVNLGALRHVLTTLPEEFNALFAAGHEGRLSDYAGVTHEQIAQRAHAIWEESGRPEGQHLEHWTRAEQELRSSSSGEPAMANGGGRTDKRRDFRQT
jgi:hypothetical protein